MQQPQRINVAAAQHIEYMTLNIDCLIATYCGCVCHIKATDRHFIPGIDAFMPPDKAAISYFNATTNCSLKTHFDEQHGEMRREGGGVKKK